MLSKNVDFSEASRGNEIINTSNSRTNLQLANKNICPDKLQTKQNSEDTSEAEAGFKILQIHFHNPEGV